MQGAYKPAPCWLAACAPMLSWRLSRALTAASALHATAESLQLRQLQVIHRHGDRTPITPLADRAYWSTILPSAAELVSLERGTTVIRSPGSVPLNAAPASLACRHGSGQ